MLKSVFRPIIFGLALSAMVACASPSGNDIPARQDSDVLDNIIMTRRSVRAYKDQAVSRDTLNLILKAGINAPNGQNRQAYEIRIVDSPEFLNAVSQAVKSDNPGMSGRMGGKSVFAGAPCVIFIANDTTYDVSQVDCGLLGENIILSAWSMGIGSCCMAGPVRMMKDSESCAPYLEKLGFSEGYNLLYCITLGYPDETPDARPRKNDVYRFMETD